MKTLQRIAQSCLEFHVSELYIALVGRGKNYANLHAVVKICQIFIISKLLKAFNSHRFNQSDLYTRSWYHGTAASMECLQAPPYTPSSPDRSRLVPLNLDYTRLARSKTNREPVRRLILSWYYGRDIVLPATENHSFVVYLRTKRLVDEFYQPEELFNGT